MIVLLSRTGVPADYSTTRYSFAVVSLSNRTAHAPCFLQQNCDYCVTCVSFQLASPSGFHITYIPKGNLVFSLPV